MKLNFLCKSALIECKLLNFLMLWAICAALSIPSAAHAGLSSEWVKGMSSKTRLLAGAPDASINDSKATFFAGVEISMPIGWKTYWRTPGDAGGIPPSFDWAQSINVKSVNVLYPAPERLSDKSGDLIGYMDGIVFPVEVIAEDPSQAVKLALKIDYGICKNICVPVEAELTLDVPAGQAGEIPIELAEGLSRIPKLLTEGQSGPGPHLVKWQADLASPAPRLELEFGYADKNVDVFLDLADGSYAPMTKLVSLEGKVARFEADLSGVDLKSLQSQPLRITIVSGADEVETAIHIK